MKTKVLFRVDGGYDVGLGHLVRSIFLAKRMQKAAYEIIFVCNYSQILNEKIQEAGFNSYYNEKNLAEEQFLLEAIKNLNINNVFIDSLYEYSTTFIEEYKNVKFVFFHNSCEASKLSLATIIPSAHTDEKLLTLRGFNEDKLFIGPEYVIINDRIINIKKEKVLFEENRNTKIVVTTGGSDPKGVLLTLILYLGSIELRDLEVVILVGENFLHLEKFNEILFSFKSNFSNLKAIPYDVKELVKADIAIATFGVTTYELLYLGIPILSVAHAIPNAKGSERLADKYNVVRDLGLIDDLTKKRFEKELFDLINSKEKREELALKGEKLIDGKGLERVTEILIDKFKA